MRSCTFLAPMKLTDCLPQANTGGATTILYFFTEGITPSGIGHTYSLPSRRSFSSAFALAISSGFCSMSTAVAAMTFPACSMPLCAIEVAPSATHVYHRLHHPGSDQCRKQASVFRQSRGKKGKCSKE